MVGLRTPQRTRCKTGQDVNLFDTLIENERPVFRMVDGTAGLTYKYIRFVDIYKYIMIYIMIYIIVYIIIYIMELWELCGWDSQSDVKRSPSGQVTCHIMSQNEKRGRLTGCWPYLPSQQ